MRTIEMYDNVPDGSTLELKAGPADGAFTVTALFSTSGDMPDEKWKASEIRPGPRTHPLERGKAYVLEVRLAFLGSVKAVLDARVRKPGGSIFSTPKVWEVTGAKGDKELRVLIIRMEP
jgi:hypothetical protein